MKDDFDVIGYSTHWTWPEAIEFASRVGLSVWRSDSRVMQSENQFVIGFGFTFCSDYSKSLSARSCAVKSTLPSVFRTFTLFLSWYLPLARWPFSSTLLLQFKFAFQNTACLLKTFTSTPWSIVSFHSFILSITSASKLTWLRNLLQVFSARTTCRRDEFSTVLIRCWVVFFVGNIFEVVWWENNCKVFQNQPMIRFLCCATLLCYLLRVVAFLCESLINLFIRTFR